MPHYTASAPCTLPDCGWILRTVNTGERPGKRGTLRTIPVGIGTDKLMAKTSKTHYEVLDIASNADQAQIKRAYRERIRRYHPDQFVAERRRLEHNGTVAQRQKVEKKLAYAQKMTQQINAAYAVLSDPIQRKRYDRRLAERTNQNVQREAYDYRRSHPDYPRRTVKNRPHHNPTRQRPPTPQEEAIPWAIMGGLVLVLLLVFSGLTNFFSSMGQRPEITAIGYTAYELQETQNAINATRIARTRTANDPTATPRSAEDNEIAADRLYDLERYADAVDLYGRAIAVRPHVARLYYKRGLAYLALYQQGNPPARESALSDFSRTLELDDTWAGAYRERGLLYYLRWVQTGEDATAQQARADLLDFVALSDEPDSFVQASLEHLSDDGN